MSERYAAVERALREAAPHELLNVVRASLTEHFAANSVNLLIADYAMTLLQPIDTLPYTAAPLSVHTSEPGRAFGAQQPLLRSAGTPPVVTAHLPISVRGDRLGVLSLALPEEHCSRATLGELEQLADVLGREIVIAERDTDLYLQARRTQRLTLAAEMQWQLLPSRACSRAEYALGGQLEPAYAIHGDNFDWSSSADHLTLTVTNGMGEGIEAALLTHLAVNALRNARRAGLDLRDQAHLADQAVYGQYEGAVHLPTLLLRFNLNSGLTEVIDAGSPRLWRLREGSLERIEPEAQLPLGMFEDTIYHVEQFEVRPGDRLLIVSDGVYDVASPTGEKYQERALAHAVNSARLLPASHVPRAVLDELAGHREAAEIGDDATIVCLDWFGR
ncbi:PP2C family protein-serine/threonine phosphatase [Streptomyces lunalinharesii]|uniref:PP2C family protein-serine/threonine phosphatase n=1 Tax=Streptomyces lunalinharesii TaxID=333384 RepID=A0ABP6EEK5_9ACTN